VVCGLEVGCDPCGGVIVRPGYALDCCGNDLVLACDRRLDINEMIAALREARHGGHGCPDPCQQDGKAPPCEEADQPGDDKGEVTGSDAAAAARVRFLTDSDDEMQVLDRGQPVRGASYCLYLRYDERATEPVARYATGDDCGGGCEPTRIAEGVTFELRCPPERALPSDLFTALVGAVDCLGRSERDSRDFGLLQYLGDRLELAGYALDGRVSARVIVGRPQVETWMQGVEHWLKQPESGTRIMELTRRLAELEGPYHASARGQLREHPDLAKAARKHVEKLFTEVREAVYAAAEREQKHATLSPLEVAFLTTTAELSRRVPDHLETAVYAMTELPPTSAPPTSAPPTSAPPSAPPAPPAEPPSVPGVPWTPDSLYRYGAVWGRTLQTTSITSIRGLATSVHGAVRCDTAELPDCALANDAAALARTPLFDLDLIDRRSSKLAIRWITTGVEVFVRYLVARMCLAVNPPCRPCTDPAVLLACIEVDHCKVVKVCNLTRDYVWSPTALQHWLPPARWFGQVLEAACCEPRKLATPKGMIDELDDLDLGLAAGKVAWATPFYRRHLHPRVMTIVFESVGQLFRQRLGRGVAGVLAGAR
jgi:hypothetical protein